MLILTRRIGETIFIGNDIRVVMRRLKGTQISVGVVAPKGTPVYREELARRIQVKRHPGEGERPVA
jgi:carbon storage regulator